tara:strand:- start:6960 stop:7460 length:501 start_codon:yes stop_codon:yes gene_type:complete
MGFTHIGKITKHKGLKGYCILRLNSEPEFNFKKMDSLYIELSGSKVPFSVEKLLIINSKTIELKFKNYNSREANNILINGNVFLKNKKGIEFESELSKIIGYDIKENNKVIGTITNFHKKNQPILFCEINNKETLIPYTKEIVHRVDNLKKEIHVIIPKGLLDLNQ